MQPGEYVLSKDRFSIRGDYTLADVAGTAVLRFDGKLRIAVRFDTVDADGRVLFTGQGRLISVTDRFAFSRDGQPYASMWAEWEGGLQRVGKQKGRYVVACESGDAFDTSGDMHGAWTLRRREVDVAHVDRRERAWHITLLDAADSAFLMTIVMAVVLLTLGHERTFD